MHALNLAPGRGTAKRQRAARPAFDTLCGAVHYRISSVPSHGEPPIGERTGHTLIELVVALALLALLAALVAPQLLSPRAPAPEGTAEVVVRARRLAVERATPMRLSVSATGDWRVASARTPDQTLIAGRLPAPQSRASVELSPTGLCLPTTGTTWDPARCAPVLAPLP